MTYWPRQMESKIEPIFFHGHGAQVYRAVSKRKWQPSSQAVRKLIEGTEEPGEEEKRACHVVTKDLQVRFDTMLLE